jgi:fatty acid desaturase
MGMGKRYAGMVSGAGMLVQAAVASQGSEGSQPAEPRSRLRRLLGAAAALTFWLLCNLVILFVLFGLSLFPAAPPLILMVAAVLPNFYLIPLARRLADSWPARTPRYQT